MLNGDKVVARQAARRGPARHHARRRADDDPGGRFYNLNCTGLSERRESGGRAARLLPGQIRDSGRACSLGTERNRKCTAVQRFDCQRPARQSRSALGAALTADSLDGGLVSTQIIDEERKINLNLLFDPRKRQPDPTWTPIIERVLANAGASPDLLPILIDWLDPDSIESQGGAEADYYLRLMPPYEPRNGPMPTIFDLRMIKGMDDATFMNLSHFLTAGPFSQAQINVNTAPAEVLAALAPQLENDPSLVKSIIEARADGPFAMITDLNNRVSGLPQDQALQRLLTVSSNDFSIIGDGGFAGARKRIYSTFKRIRLQRSGASFILANWHED